MKQRRKLPPGFKKIFDEWLENSTKYGDRITRVKTISMWENCEDVESDCQVACNIIEELLPTELDAAMNNIKKLSRKASVFLIQCDAIRKADYWKSQIAAHFMIVHFETIEDRIACLAAPSKTGMVGKLVSAGTDEHRWNNIVRNSAAYPQRVKTEPAHDRKAIIACYGPSLADNLLALRRIKAEGNADIVSVSGSHDYLIAGGITPDYHVEADPRPHKAGNIAKAVPGVKYLLASMVDKDVFDKLEGGDISLWHVSGEQTIRLLDEVEPGALLIGGRGNVGICALPLMYELGYREFHIFGMDCSYKDGEEIKRHAGAHANKKLAVEMPVVDGVVEGRKFKTSPIYITYADLFFQTRAAMLDCSFAMYGDSFLTAWCLFEQRQQANRGAA